MKDLLTVVCERMVERGYLAAAKVERITSFLDQDLVDAIKLFHWMDPFVAQKKLEMTGEPLIPDGIMGPASWEAMNEMNACGCSNIAPANWTEPATGSGNHRGCHGLPDNHTSLYLVDSTRRPSWMSPQMWREILRRSQEHGNEMGWHHIWVDKFTHENVLTGEPVDVRAESIEGTLLFEKLPGTTIGLAHVPDPGQPCGSDWIWAKVDPDYHPQDPLSEYVTLVDHESYGHNGSMRFRGGAAHVPANLGRSIMSSSIQPGQDGWKNDPAWDVAANLYGGVMHPGWGTTPPPPEPPPEPPEDDKPGVGERLSSVFKYDYGGETLWASIKREFDRTGG